MGLDMYLTADVYISPYNEKETPLRDKIKEAMKTEFTPEEVKFRIMYWRKANQIHKWFVENVQDGKDDCGTYYVTKEQLQQLLEVCKQALASKFPDKVLPTQSGFFFGSTEYDEYYDKDLNDTIEGLTKWLNSKESDIWHTYYHSSW